jgi:hypothetical protein
MSKKAAIKNSLVKAILAISATMMSSLAVVFLVRYCVNVPTLSANNDVAGNYLQTLGTVYAVLLAFVVFVVWTQYNDSRRAVETEANEVRDLHRILMSLSPPLERARQCLEEYVARVISEEWDQMALGKTSVGAAQSLEEIWSSIEGFEPRNSREEVLLGEALERFDDLSDARAGRLCMMRQRLPISMWALLLVGGTLTVASMALFGLDSLLAHALMTSALAGLIAFVLSVVADLDNAFSGAWRVTPLPFQELPRGWGATSTSARAHASVTPSVD